MKTETTNGFTRVLVGQILVLGSIAELFFTSINHSGMEIFYLMIAIIVGGCLIHNGYLAEHNSLC